MVAFAAWFYFCPAYLQGKKKSKGKGGGGRDESLPTVGGCELGRKVYLFGFLIFLGLPGYALELTPSYPYSYLLGASGGMSK